MPKKTKRYHHLNQKERDLIAILKAAGQSLRAIARRLRRNPGTISRELKRNAPPVHRGYYLPHKAQARATARHGAAHRRPRLKAAKTRAYVGRRLTAGWSPELISGRLKHLKLAAPVSHEAIYQWVYAEARHLIEHLARAHRRRRPRGYGRKHKKAHIPGRVSIARRPRAVATRRTGGHWETDTAVSRASQASLSITVERKTRLTKLSKLRSRSARAVRVALNRRLARLPARLRQTITYDNGSENTEHQLVNAVLKTASYFCEPYHSWEKGTVENTVGLVRRFLPKGTDFAKVPRRDIRRIERWLNHRPRKCLNYQTPAEAFKAECCT
jgi:IS30 family transposase